jgi:hypothetical protein
MLALAQRDNSAPSEAFYLDCLAQRSGARSP